MYIYIYAYTCVHIYAYVHIPTGTQALAVAREHSWQEADRADKLEQTLLHTRAEGVQCRQGMRALREQLEELERQLRECEQDNASLKQLARAGKEVLEGTATLQHIVTTFQIDSNNLRLRLGDAALANETLGVELADARIKIEHLQMQKADLENMVREDRASELTREMQEKMDGVEDHDMFEDHRMFGLQASIVALNASLLSYQHDIEQMQRELDAEQLLSADLEHVIRSTLERQQDAAVAEGAVDARVWSDKARALFDVALVDLRARATRTQKRRRQAAPPLHTATGKGSRQSHARKGVDGRGGGRSHLRVMRAGDGVGSGDSGSHLKTTCFPTHVGASTHAAVSGCTGRGGERTDGMQREQDRGMGVSSPGSEASSQDSSSLVSGEGGEGAREQTTKLQLAVASAEWALVRARVSWEELGSVHQRARDLMSSLLEFRCKSAGVGVGSAGESDKHGSKHERAGERKWEEVERFLCLTPPSLPAALKEGGLLATDGVQHGGANCLLGGLGQGGLLPSKRGEAAGVGSGDKPRAKTPGGVGGETHAGLDTTMLRVHMERLEMENEKLHSAVVALEGQVEEQDVLLEDLEDELDTANEHLQIALQARHHHLDAQHPEERLQAQDAPEQPSSLSADAACRAHGAHAYEEVVLKLQHVEGELREVLQSKEARVNAKDTLRAALEQEVVTFGSILLRI